MIRWAFEAKIGDLSEIFEFGNRFVIARLDVIREEGTAPLDQVYGEVETAVRNDKKADYLIEEFSGADLTKSLEDIAAELALQVRNVENATFSSMSIPGIGVEPAISAALAVIPEGRVSEPIKGNNGVYIIRTTSIISPEQTMDVVSVRNRLQQSLSSRAGYQAFQALQEKANVIDKRNKFY